MQKVTYYGFLSSQLELEFLICMVHGWAEQLIKHDVGRNSESQNIKKIATINCATVARGFKKHTKSWDSQTVVKIQ